MKPKLISGKSGCCQPVQILPTAPARAMGKPQAAEVATACCIRTLHQVKYGTETVPPPMPKMADAKPINPPATPPQHGARPGADQSADHAPAHPRTEQVRTHSSMLMIDSNRADGRKYNSCHGRTYGQVGRNFGAYPHTPQPGIQHCLNDPATT